MPRRLPPLTALRAFEAAARLGSISAAADELLVTHGAVSRQIQGLEAWIGVPVFERVGRRIRLTEGGRAYRDAVRDAFDAIGHATERLAGTARSQQLTVNALPTFTMRWLLPRLTRFQQRYPEVALRLVTSDQPLARLEGAFDLAIRRGPEPWPDLVAEPFLEEREVPVCAPALLAVNPIRTPADLAHHTLLHADTRPLAWSRWLRAAGVPELAAAGRQQFDHFYLALQAAMDGLGVVLGPLPIIDDDVAAGRLVAPLAGPAVKARSYCWAVPKRLADEPVALAFRQWLAEEGKGSQSTAPVV